jgi:hypothetical protein
MKTTQKCAVVLILLVLVGCENEAARRQPIPVALADKGEPVTLHIPRGYIEQPKKPEGVLPNVILRIAAQDFSGAALAPESEVRVLIEPTASAVDAAHKLHAAASRKHKSSEEALVKSAELSKPGLIAYSYPNGSEDSKAYYLTSNSGDVFVECRRSVCKAFRRGRSECICASTTNPCRQQMSSRWMQRSIACCKLSRARRILLDR